MLHFKRINTKDSYYTFVENLLTSSFPKEERRDLELQRLYTDSKRNFHCHVVLNDEEPVGLITLWDFGKFQYIEHFAVSKECRNKGYGKIVLNMIKEMVNVPIILEAEEPTDEISCRRIDFYLRNGFVLHNYPYLQPPYRDGDNWFPLKLMTYGTIEINTMYEEIKSTIYTQVYNQ